MVGRKICVVACVNWRKKKRIAENKLASLDYFYTFLCIEGRTIKMSLDRCKTVKNLVRFFLFVCSMQHLARAMKNTNDSRVWNSFGHIQPYSATFGLLPDSNSFDDRPQSRNRRHPLSTESSIDTIDAYFDNCVIIKLDRNQFLDSLVGEINRSHQVLHPVEFFPSLDGKPR